MTIFVWFILVIFVLWLLSALIGIVGILMESEIEVLLKKIHGRPHGLDLGKALFHTVVPFLGVGACIGYLFS